jgi:hypothetical protein
MWGPGPRNLQIAVLCKVCFRKKHNVNVATGKKKLQLESMLR